MTAGNRMHRSAHGQQAADVGSSHERQMEAEHSTLS